VQMRCADALEHGQATGIIMLRGLDINFRMIRAGHAWHAAEERCGPAWLSVSRLAITDNAKNRIFVAARYHVE
jgi:hypothetical protein